MKAEILKLLKETESFLSGQELCQLFGVSRTAVWKVIQQLEEEGFVIEAVRNKGYKLVGSSDVMSKAELASCRKGRWAGCQIEFFEEVDSTNTMAKRLAEEGAPHGTLVAAQCQSQGKGRRGRAWTSPPGTGIWMSVILRPDIHPASASMLTLVIALAVQAGIRQATGLVTSIKWPNDIVAGGKKLCGILTEMSAEPEAVHYVVAGIGINANMTSFPEELKEKATSLLLETGSQVRRSRVVSCVLESLEYYYEKFLENGDLSGLQGDYNGKLVNYGAEVRVMDPKESYTGTSMGIDEKGELLVQKDVGDICHVVSGEVSVRGIYGYV